MKTQTKEKKQEEQFICFDGSICVRNENNVWVYKSQAITKLTPTLKPTKEKDLPKYKIIEQFEQHYHSDAVNQFLANTVKDIVKKMKKLS